MKRAVGHKNQMLALKERVQRGDEFAIERFQMALGRAQERLFKPLHIIIAHAKFRDLKTQQLQEVRDARNQGHRENLGSITRYDGGNHLVAGNKVLNQSRLMWQDSLEFLQRKIGRRFQGRVFSFVSRQFTQGPQQLLLMRLRDFLKIFEFLAGLCLRP